MKKLLTCLLWLIATGTLFAQNPVTLNVVNAKGKSLDNKATVSLKSNPAGQSPDKNSPLKLQPTANDTIFVLVGQFMGQIPADGLTEATIVADKGKMTNRATGEEYKVVKLPPFDPNNIAASPYRAMFINLENLVTSKFPTVKIQEGDAYLSTNTTSSTGDNYTPMLILVDGNQVVNFASANETISIQQVKSVVVKRSDPLYGLRGAGGIMEITLVKGGDQ